MKLEQEVFHCIRTNEIKFSYKKKIIGKEKFSHQILLRSENKENFGVEATLFYPYISIDSQDIKRPKIFGASKVNIMNEPTMFLLGNACWVFPGIVSIL